MNPLTLSLRQRKLIHYIQHQTGYTTGSMLAAQLNVSTRTIRNDMNEINRILKTYNIEISSKRSQGYMLSSKNAQRINQLNQSGMSFISRDDRTRYIAFRLCLSDDPLDLYDLEDEMFISHTTLEHDLIFFRKTYVLPTPNIIFYRHKNSISFEKNERKRRAILNRLFTDNWNYNAKGNAYYQYQYLEEDLVNKIMPETQYFLRQYNIILEDINMVILNLMIAIAYSRIATNHKLTGKILYSYQDSTAFHASSDLLDSLEKKLSCSFNSSERWEIYLHIAYSRLLDANKLNFASIDLYFDQTIISLTNKYLDTINKTFHLTFSKNEDFYITILQYFRYLSFPEHYLNNVQQSTPDISRINLLIPFEIAFLFQPLAHSFYGRYLNYQELLYLAFCIDGALNYANRNSPKLKTIIMSQLNLTSSWNLKQKLLNRFQDYIDLIALLPVYIKDSYDFSKIDLIITTTKKDLTQQTACQTLLVSPFLTLSDQENLENLISKRQIQRLYRSKLPTLTELLTHAFWHEKITLDSSQKILELLAADFINNAYVTTAYLNDIKTRESILSFSFCPSIVFAYSLVPSTQTCLSVATLEHRIKWNSYKIRTIIMAAIRPEDSTLVFRLINELFCNNFDPKDIRFFKTKKEFSIFFKSLN